MKKNIFLVCCLAAFFILSQANAGPSNDLHKIRDISEEEAKMLLSESLKSESGAYSKKFGVDLSEKQDFPRFFAFEATQDDGDKNSVSVGNYLVDKKTGDIWSAVICEEIDSKKIAELKVEVRKKIGLTERNYLIIRVKGPYC